MEKKEQPGKKEEEDPCYGKEKEFFIYEFDQIRNVCVCTPDQLTFIACHYIEHYFQPIDILMWLYDKANERDERKKYLELQAFKEEKEKKWKVFQE